MEELLNLSKQLSFKCEIVSPTSSYYLWMCELQKHLHDKHEIDVYVMPVFRNKCGYDSFKRDGYTFEVMMIEPCQYLTWASLNVCAEDRDEEIAEIVEDCGICQTYPHMKPCDECKKIIGTMPSVSKINDALEMGLIEGCQLAVKYKI